MVNCKWCERKFKEKGYANHKNYCKPYKVFTELLDKKRVINHPKYGFWVSGGAKVILMLKGKGTWGAFSESLKGKTSTQDWRKGIKKIMDFENEYNIDISYNSDKDKIRIKKRTAKKASP